MISILIPTYNYNVVDLVKSLHVQLNLSEAQFEIKVYDDGSPNPKSENETLQNFKNTTYKELEKNIGRSAIRNLMATEAKYDWLLFLDADVFPKNLDFIENYIKAIKNEECDVIFGGITYDKEKPVKEKILRWKYGWAREAKSAEYRNKIPFVIVTGNLLIKKMVFQKINTIHENLYGEDLVLSHHIKVRKIQVIHIENPVIHLGLETSEHFLKKSVQGVKNLVVFENDKQLKNDFTKLQRSYLKLKKIHLTQTFSFIISKMKGRMEQNFMSKNPNLFLFDLYRLNYYIQFKNKTNA